MDQFPRHIQYRSRFADGAEVEAEDAEVMVVEKVAAVEEEGGTVYRRKGRWEIALRGDEYCGSAHTDIALDIDIALTLAIALTLTLSHAWERGLGTGDWKEM